MKRDSANYVHENLVADIINVNWFEVLEEWKGDPKHSHCRFDEKVLSKKMNFMVNKKLCNKIIDIMRFSKKTHYHRYFAKNSGNIKKTWCGIKSIINICYVTKKHSTSMLTDKNLKTNPTDIAEGFNAYF